MTNHSQSIRVSTDYNAYLGFHDVETRRWVTAPESVEQTVQNTRYAYGRLLFGQRAKADQQELAGVASPLISSKNSRTEAVSIFAWARLFPGNDFIFLIPREYVKIFPSFSVSKRFVDSLRPYLTLHPVQTAPLTAKVKLIAKSPRCGRMRPRSAPEV